MIFLEIRPGRTALLAQQWIAGIEADISGIAME